ncbi:MAG: hypothetical protein HUJ68_10150 [Clostridia bacterium]|nr:hypothetical protein [Clostridia bacterium]
MKRFCKLTNDECQEINGGSVVNDEKGITIIGNNQQYNEDGTFNNKNGNVQESNERDLENNAHHNIALKK